MIAVENCWHFRSRLRKLNLNHNQRARILGTFRGAEVLGTTVGYLLGETEDRELLKDPSILKRLNDIAKFPKKDKNCILYALDAMINNVKLKAIQ